MARFLEQLAEEASASLPLLLQSLWELLPEDIDDTMALLERRMSLEPRVLEGLSVPLAVTKKVISCKNLIIDLV